MNYEVRVVPKFDAENNLYWTAFFPTVPECVGGGKSVEEAVKEAYENLEVYLEYLKSENLLLPKEYKEENFNGKIALRVSKSTHRQLVCLAEEEGVSLNMIINNAIEQYLGKKNYDFMFAKKIEELGKATESSLALQQINLSSNKKIFQNLINGKYKIYYGGENV